jgi:hypothetical protein
MRVRDGLAASRLHAAGRKHHASYPATTTWHDHLIVTDQRRAASSNQLDSLNTSSATSG